ncbi:hypothetical protein [Streptomyces sp. NPDC020917]|uniref:hypothetical protein n=1 Tax=Streptomyces sp. NPDC020917 TaxID=3365102 RepID=UPI0037B70C70
MRCGVCGSQRLSPVGQLRPGSKINDRLEFKVGRPRLLKFRPKFEVAFARACLNCGTLFPCLGEDERQRLAELGDEAEDEPKP